MTESDQPPPRGIFELLEIVKKCAVFVGRPQGMNPNWFATGCIVSIKNAFYLVTAKHVVVDPRTGQRTDDGLCFFYNLVGGGLAARPVAHVQAQGLDWIFHDNQEVDLAMIPTPLKFTQDDVGIIPENMFAPLDSIEETWDVVYAAYQPGLEDSDRVAPVLRTGMISRKNPDGTFLIDGSAFPGNSGCPVFIKPQGMRLSRQGALLGGDPSAFRFAGIIGAYVPYQEDAVSRQTGLVRVVFQENTGLSRVWSTDLLRELVSTRAFLEQAERIKTYKESNTPPTRPT